MGDEFVMNNATDVEKHNEHGLRWAAAHSCLLQSWRWWALPLWWLPLCLRVIPIDPRLVTSDDPGREGWIICAHGDLDTLQRDVPSAQRSAVRGQTWQWHAACSIPTLGLSVLTHTTHQQYQQYSWSPSNDPHAQVAEFSIHFRGGDARSCRSFVFKGRSSAFEVPLPLKTLRTTHCLIAVCLPKHVQCLCDRFAQVNANFHAGSFHLSVLDVISDYHTHTGSQKHKYNNSRC
jgi:hypothetical protein